MIKELEKIYQGKKVFLTGHTGFKGSWLLKILSLLGAEVKGYALSPEITPNLFDIFKGNSLCDSVIGDIRDRQNLTDAIVAFQPDFIFHLAAQPLVRQSYVTPSETFEVNAVGSANVLDAIRLLDKTCYAIFITTDKVYHNYEWVFPYRENDRLGGYDPYSASKACTELVIDSYRNSFFNVNNYNEHKKAIAVGRAGNVIGGGDWSKDRLIPDIVKALSENQVIQIRNPRSVRPWQHVMEPLFGYLLLGAHLQLNPLKFSQAYNFGPRTEDALPVREMVSLAIADWGEGKYLETEQSGQLHEAGLLTLDISKVKADLNWFPKLTATEAVNKTISWYKAYYQKKDMAVFTEHQIKEFLHN